jgi:hypothetical protein
MHACISAKQREDTAVRGDLRSASTHQTPRNTPNIVRIIYSVRGRQIQVKIQGT